MSDHKSKPLLVLVRQRWERIRCALGIHGPHIYGWRSHERSSRTSGFVRVCTFCRSEWHGCEVERGRGANAYRTVGDWWKVR